MVEQFENSDLKNPTTPGLARVNHGAYDLKRQPAPSRSRNDTSGSLHDLGFPVIKVAMESHTEAGIQKPPAPRWGPEESIGPAAGTDAGRSMERIALAQLGQSIDDGYGADGCMQSLSNHVIKPHLAEVGRSAEFPGTQSTSDFIRWAKQHPDLVDVQRIPQRDLRAADLQPGDVVIGNKSDGNHAMVAGRLPAAWGGSPETLALLGNTGHPETAPDGPNKPHFRVQEFIGTPQDEARFGTHHQGPESASPDNPYNKPNSYWTIVRFKV